VDEEKMNINCFQRRSLPMALGFSLGALASCFSPKPFPAGGGNDADSSTDRGGVPSRGDTGGDSSPATGGLPVSDGAAGDTGGTVDVGKGDGGPGGTVDVAMGSGGAGGAAGTGGGAGTGGTGGMPVNNCLFDEQFTAPTLGLDWNPTAAGQAPTYTIANGKLVITNAARAATPSQPTEPDASWIYDVDKDLGNQMARRVDIGRGDFVLDGSFQWDSQLDQEGHMEGWLGGIALTDSTHHVKAMITAYDPRVRLGSPVGLAVWALLARPDAFGTVEQEFVDPVDHTVRFRIARTGGVVRFTVNDQPVRFMIGNQEVSSTLITADIAAVAIVTVRLGSFNDTLKFGRLFVDQIRLCRSAP
jgi:hypothetical protein